MTTALLVIHTIICFVLVGLVLLNAGRGGMSDLFGGGGGGGGGSTIMERNLDRYTVIVSIVFAITTLALVWLLG